MTEPAAPPDSREPIEDELPLERRSLRSILSLIPRRDVARVVMLLLFLVVIVALQRRSGAIVKSLGDGLFGPAPASAPAVRLKPPSP